MTRLPAKRSLGHRIIKKVKDAIVTNGMLDKGDTVIVAVSGGVDSMVLLHVLNRMRKDFDLSLVVCHLNHGLRGKESDRDFRLVRKTCEGIGLKFEGKRLKAGELKLEKGSLQEAARIKRYEFFEDAAKKHSAKKIALGHTIDDQAETVLMRVIKGSSLTGLAGIPPVRGPFIRPLIGIKKEELKRFAEEEGIGYVEDSSNLSPKYLRNDLRLNLIPAIKRYNPNLAETLARTASVLSDDDECLESLALELMPGMIIKKGQAGLVLDRQGLTKIHKSLAARVFLKAVALLRDKSDTYSVHVKSFLRILNGKSVSSSVSLPGGLKVRREYDKVIILTRPLTKVKPFDRTVNVPGITRLGEHVLKATILNRPPGNFACNDNMAYFDYTAIKGPLNLRSIMPGDRMTPFGMKGSKKLKEILIEKKIPRVSRPEIPLLCHEKDILWAVCVRRSELLRVKRGTKKILKIEYMKR
jgi:tRNA(Ile)-lysidine synthase